MVITKFALGTIATTPNALAILGVCYTLPEDLLERHASGDWGDLSAEDRQRNEDALQDGSRLFSRYFLMEICTVLVVTDAIDDVGIRHSTTIFLPGEH